MIDFLKYVAGDLSRFSDALPVLRTILLVVLILIIFNFLISALTGIVKRILLLRAKTKRHASNIAIFTSAAKYILLFLIVVFAVFYYTGSWSGLGISIGLVSAALGLALSRPIMGVAAWILILTKRPFEIGDRITIQTSTGAVKGDVIDITPSHIHIKEIGGSIKAEEYSGRTVIIPSSAIFEQNIINHSHENEFVLDKVVFTVTYDSNLDKALPIALDAAKKHTKSYLENVPRQPFVRMSFQASGIDVEVRYFTHIDTIGEKSSQITREIFDKVKASNDIEFAYPHVQVVKK